MKIKQCHISKSVHDFPFMRLYKLGAYSDSLLPCIFFGCYDSEDFKAIISHKSTAVIWWCGQDALDFQDWNLFGKNVFHITERIKVYEHLKKSGIPCNLNQSSDLAEPAKITPLGNKVFVYMPSSYPEYHGKNIIDQIKFKIATGFFKYELIIGDGSIPQDDWRAGACEEIYEQCFIGLVLSHFAGGGASVIELGKRGRKCVTNVMHLGNVINWNTVDDVVKSIEEEAKNIGFVNYPVILQTMKSIDYTNQFLNLNNYE